MDVLSGVASTSQLLAYTHSTFQILIRLYKQVKEGPTAIRQQQTCVRVLLTAVDSLNKQPVPEYVLATLLKLSTLAIEALHLIAKSQEKGFLGLHWAAVRNDPALSQVFASLRECRENLLLAISIDTWQVTKDSSKIMGLLNPKKACKDIKDKFTGSMMLNRVGNGEMKKGEVIRIDLDITGDRNINDVGNITDLDREIYRDFFRIVMKQEGDSPHTQSGSHKQSTIRCLPETSFDDLSISECRSEPSSPNLEPSPIRSNAT